MMKKMANLKLDQFENVKDWYEATEALDQMDWPTEIWDWYRIYWIKYDKCGYRK